MNVDYKKYTLTELYEVKDNIDKKKYPDNYQLLLNEIKNRDNTERDIEFANNDIKRVIFAVISIASILMLLYAYQTDRVYFYLYKYDLVSEPDRFHLYVGIHIIVLIYSLFKVFSLSRSTNH